MFAPTESVSKTRSHIRLFPRKPVVVQSEHDQPVLLNELFLRFVYRIVRGKAEWAPCRTARVRGIGGGGAGPSCRPKNVGSYVTIRLAPLLEACFRTSIVAMAVVAIPFTGVCGSPALKPSSPVAGHSPTKCGLQALGHRLRGQSCRSRERKMRCGCGSGDLGELSSGNAHAVLSGKVYSNPDGGL